MRPTRIALTLVLSVLTPLVVLTASPVQADDGVWYQSVQRASPTAPCPEPSFGTPWQSNWNLDDMVWRPSWAAWPNGGKGGYTCDRKITWANPLYPSAGCVRYYDAGADLTKYVNFGGGWSIGTGPRYNDAACSILYEWAPGNTSPIVLKFVYAPWGWSALDLCREAFSVGPEGITLAGTDGVYFCQRAVA